MEIKKKDIEGMLKSIRNKQTKLKLYDEILDEINSCLCNKERYEQSLKNEDEDTGIIYLRKMAIFTWIFRLLQKEKYEANMGSELTHFSRLDYETDFVLDIKNVVEKHRDILYKEIDNYFPCV